MNFEGEIGTENVEKVAKLESLGNRTKEIGHSPDSKTYPVVGPSGYDPLKNSDDPVSCSKLNPSVKRKRSVNSRNPRNTRMQVVVGASGSQVEIVGTNFPGESTTLQPGAELGGWRVAAAASLPRKKKHEKKKINFFFPKIRLLRPPYSDSAPPKPKSGPSYSDSAPLEPTSLLRPCNFSNRKVGALMDTNKEETTKEDEKYKLLTNNYSTNQNRYDKLKARFGDPPMEVWKPLMINVEAALTERNIPPHNVEATSPDMAYPLKNIIFKGEWKYLEDILELVEAGLEVSPDVYPTFVCNRVHKIAAIKDKKKRKTMAGILSYITHLIKYKDRHSLFVVSSMRPHELPSILAQRFSSLFCVTEQKNIPAQKQLLLISYVLVLSLFADDFRSDPSDIAKDLRMSPSSLRVHYTSLGCKFFKGKSTLYVPLELPTRK